MCKFSHAGTAQPFSPLLLFALLARSDRMPAIRPGDIMEYIEEEETEDNNVKVRLKPINKSKSRTLRRPFVISGRASAGDETANNTAVYLYYGTVIC